MGYVEAARLINAPVETVWNSLHDIARTPEWVVGLEKAEITTSGPPGEGTIYMDYNRLGPFLQVSPWHITTFEPMRQQVHESHSKTIPSRLTLNLAPAAGGTHLQFIMEFQFLPQLRPVGQLLENLLLKRMISQIIHQNLVNLDAYLTAQAQATQQGDSQAALI